MNFHFFFSSQFLSVTNHTTLWWLTIQVEFCYN